AHHIDHHAHGGPTDTPNLALLCRHHHGIIHRHGWTMTPTTTPDNESHTGYFTITTTDGTQLPTQHRQLPPPTSPAPAWARDPPGTPHPHPPPDSHHPRPRAGNTASAAAEEVQHGRRRRDVGVGRTCDQLEQRVRRSGPRVSRPDQRQRSEERRVGKECRARGST